MMATTGNLPPNCRSGQAFLNDPNIHGTSEVKGQIKLKLTTANRKPAVCTRSFSLTQKPQKREYKAFEAALRTVDQGGQQQTLSYKCADLNKLVPEMMGVSHAVLDSVIFVHQARATSAGRPRALARPASPSHVHAAHPHLYAALAHAGGVVLAPR